jgi:TatD DNase family protein
MYHKLIDSHCHLDDDRFDEDRVAMMQRAQACGISNIIIPATTAKRWPKVYQVAEEFAGVSASYGLHPMFMSQHQPEDIALLDAWLQQYEAVAVGECGLDFFIPDQDQDAQLKLFRDQLKIAGNHQLPVIIHARKALDLVIREIRNSHIESGVIHSFSGSLQQAQQLVELGFKLGIAAIVGYERANKLRQIVREIDMNALLIETDAPDQSGPQHRGVRNEPAFIIDHLSTVANLREMDVDECAKQLSQNCRQLFKLTD